MTISRALRERVRQQAGDRCGYCLSAQRYVFGSLEVEHLIPRALGGTDEEINLWLACRFCNNYKGAKIAFLDPMTGEEVALFNPREMEWKTHFMWSADGTQIIGVTACGRATVAALQMNNSIAVLVRQQWVAAGWHPPDE
ncbi:MAG: HNH endonuclease [Anaerolineae bacterium]|nr:HNH endonuclease [Anaerolineae bacterium]